MLVALFAVATLVLPLGAQDPVVAIRVDARRAVGAMTPAWAFFGYDEPNYTYMKDGRKLLSELAALSSTPVFVRTHNLLTTGDGTPALKWGSTNAYTEDFRRTSTVRLAIVDRIFDTFVERRMKPIVEIGFMPQALSTTPIRTNTTGRRGSTTTGSTPAGPTRRRITTSGGSSCSNGRATPPSGTGAREVESWYWEVWNEPDIGYWHGTPEDYQKLYDFAADGLKRAIPAARIGGPTVTGPERCAHATDTSRTSSSTAFAGPTLPPARLALRSTTSASMQKAPRAWSTATSGWASATS